MSNVIRDLLKRYNEMGISIEVVDGNLSIKAPKGALSAEQKNYIKENKSEIIKVLMEGQNESVPLNDIQSAYFLGRMEGFKYGGVTCGVYFEMIYDDLDRKKANEAFYKVIENHEMLQAVICDDGTWKRTDDYKNYQVDYRDCSDREYCNDDRMKTIRDEYSSWKSTIGKWPFFNFGITKFSNRSVLHLAMDFMIADWTSIWIIVSEFEALYYGKKQMLEPEKVTFRDYLKLEEKFRTTAKYKEDRKYWTEKINDIPAYPKLPIREDLIENRFKRMTYRLSKEKWDAFSAYAKKNNCTPTVAVISAYAATLSRWAMQDRFGLNLTMLNRMPLAEGIGSVVGDFTSVSILDVKLDWEKSFLENMKKVQLEMSEGLDHSSYSGVKLMRDITAEKGNDNAIYPFVFTGSIGLVQSESISGNIGDFGISSTPQVFIDCQAMDSERGLDVNFDIRDGIFLPEIERALFNYFSNLMDRLANNTDNWDSERIGELPTEEYKVRKEVNSTYKDIPFMPLHVRVKEASEKYKDNIAVKDTFGRMTYKELWNEVTELSKVLVECGIKRGDTVGIILPKSRYQLISVLAILSVGAVYVPFDEKQPVNRINLIIEKTGMSYYIGEENENAKKINAEIITTDRRSECDALFVRDIRSDELAYIIFTSGSTGTPKGVEITHGGADNTIMDVNERLDVSEADSVLALSRLNFDLSVYDIFGLLSVGGCVVFADNERYLDSSHWVELLNDGITVWNTVPALYQMLIDELDSEGRTAQLKKVLLSGDWIPVNFRKKSVIACPDAVLYSLGGATEGSIWSNIYTITEKDDNRKSIPYGRPLSNQQYRVVDEKLRDCPNNVIGELCIVGNGVARGYCKEEELTKAQFITCADGRRMYRTGDYGYYENDGTLIFCGRKDHQIKLHGHRIEIGEIESILCKHSAVAECKVYVDPIEKKSLVAVIKVKESVLKEDIKEYLQDNLPEYMVPSHYINVSNIPLSVNGKVDIKKLEELIREEIKDVGVNSSIDNTIEITSLTKDIHKIFEEHLGVVDMPYNGNVYDYGADSLVLSRIIGKVRDMLKEKYPQKDISFDRLLREILGKPTTAELALFVDSYEEKKTNKNQEKVSKDEKLGYYVYKGGDKDKETARLVFHAGLGTMNCFRYLIPHLVNANIGPVYGIVIEDMDRYCSIPAQEIVTRLGEEYARTAYEMGIKKVQLIGYCMGGLIALETARALSEYDIEVEDFLLVDSSPILYDIEESLALELMFITNYFITVEDVYEGITNKELMDAIMYVFNSHNKRMHAEDFKCLGSVEEYIKAARFLEKMEAIPIEQRFKDYVATIKRLGRGEASAEMLLSNYHLYVHSFSASRVDAEPYFGDVRFLEASEPMDFIFTESDVMRDYWNERILGSLEFEMVPGNHVTCIEDEENAKVIAGYANFEKVKAL